jgi:hypothetical protein
MEVRVRRFPHRSRTVAEPCRPGGVASLVGTVAPAAGTVRTAVAEAGALAAVPTGAVEVEAPVGEAAPMEAGVEVPVQVEVVAAVGAGAAITKGS